MSMNILAILLSLVMMLAGVGGDGQPAASARTMVLHDVSFTYNGETVDLAPSLKLGAATDGEKAVIDLGVQLEDETLFPIQLGVSQESLTALLQGSDVAVSISANALNTLSEQINQMTESMMSQMQDNGSGELMQVLTQELLPAYTGLIEAVKDPAFAAELQTAGQAALDSVVDRGEGTPVTEMIEGENYALTSYSYTLKDAQLAELADAVYNCNDKLANLYNALFKLYAVLPEESGLNDVTSFADLFAKFNLSMSIDMVEKTSDDGEVAVQDGVLTVNIADMIASVATQNGEEVEMPALDPIVMNIHSVKVGDVSDVELDSSYSNNGANMLINMTGHTEGTEDANIEFDMSLAQEDNGTGTIHMSVNMDTDDAGNVDSDIVYMLNVPGANMHFTVDSYKYADGAEENRFDLLAVGSGLDLALGFNLDVTTDAIVDNANGHEAALVIDDLSDEGMNNLFQDQNAQAVLMQAVGSLSVDAQKLMGDESVQQLTSLFTLDPSSRVTSYEDDGYDMDDEPMEDDYDYDYEEVEDDGVLPFNEPEFTWLPEGWHIEDTDVDTAYDMVQVNLADESGMNFGYVSFFADADNTQTNYIIAEDGTVQPVEGREVIVNDYGDGSVNMTLRENGVYAYLTFYSEEIDMDTVGKIVAGLKF